MEAKTQLSKLVIELLFSTNFLAFAVGYLDLEELRNINYGIDIVDVPVSLNPETPLPENSVQVTSKYGQLYQCSFPNQVEADKKKDEEEKVAMETGIAELLKPMEEGSCLFKTRDWWSYEFCYGKHIRQFHIEDGKVMGSVIMLGYYESDFDWDNDSEDSKTKQRNRLNRYHSQQYVNGSKCDLTGKARRTEVRFVCEEGSGDYIARLDEPETCSYIMTIHTTKICHHPYLKPLQQNKPVPITCHPIISQEEYEEYIKEEEEKRILQEKIKEEEQLAKEAAESASLMEGEEPVSMAAKGTTPDSPILPHSMKKTDKGRNFEFRDVSELKAGEMSKIEKLLQNSLKEDFDELSDQFGGQPMDVKMDVKVVKNMEDLQKVLEEAQKDAKKYINSRLKKGKKKEGEEEEEDEDGNKESGNDEEEGKELNTDNSDNTKLKFEKKSFKEKFSEDAQDLDDELSNVDSKLQEEFDEEKDGGKMRRMIQEFRRNQKNLASIKNSLKETMKEEFDDIVKEAEDETGLTMTDRKGGYKQLADTLNKLIDKLDKTEKDITNVDKELAELALKKSKNQKSDGDTPSDDETEEESADDKETSGSSPKAATSSSKSSSSLSSKSSSSSSKSLDDRVKVRVTRLKKGTLKGSSPLASTSQTEKLEQDVKEGLEKAGLDLGEGKIQVKIITAGYYDDKDDSVHVLSDEDTSAFKNMIVSILGGDHEASKEQERHDKLEENYNMVWSGRNKKKPETIAP